MDDLALNDDGLAPDRQHAAVSKLFHVFQGQDELTFEHLGQFFLLFFFKILYDFLMLFIINATYIQQQYIVSIVGTDGPVL